MHSSRPDPLVASSKREALFAAALWLAATIYSVGYCARFGYDLASDELKFVLGIPDWVFWGIVVPWTACTVVSIWFAMCIMRDEPLGAENVADPADVALPDDAANSAASREDRNA